jgi:hypothetical protein
MKQKDIALIAVIIFISAIVSYFVSNALFGSPKSRQLEYSTVQEITTDFPPANTAYFNREAFDPTQAITIGQNTNPDPFKDTTRH